MRRTAEWFCTLVAASALGAPLAGVPGRALAQSRAVVVTVTGSVNGMAAGIADMIGVQQAPFTFNERFRLNRDPISGLTWGETQFRKIGFNIADNGFFDHHGDVADPKTYHITLATHASNVAIADAGSGFTYDWSDLDRRIRYLRTTLNVKYLEFDIGNPPPSAYDPNSLIAGLAYSDSGTGRPKTVDPSKFYLYNPVDWTRYERYVADVVHHISHDLGLRGAVYTMPYGEFDIGSYYGVWAEHTEDTLDSQADADAMVKAMVVYYAHAWRAVKSVDSQAIVAAPYSTVSDKSVLSFAKVGLADFISDLAAYIKDPASIPGVGLGEIIFEQYLFDGPQHTLQDALLAIYADLKASGFCSTDRDCQKYPIVIDGWNRDFAWYNQTVNAPVFNGGQLVRDSKGKIVFAVQYQPGYSAVQYDPIDRQAFIVGNMMRQISPPDGIRRLTRSYIWPLDTDFGEHAFLAVMYPEFYGYADPVNYDLFQEPVKIGVDARYLAPVFGALQALSAMETDDLILQAPSTAPDGTTDDNLWTLATTTSDRATVHLMLVNYSATPATVTPRLPAGFANTTVAETVQTVDAAHSSSGVGLEVVNPVNVVVQPDGSLPPIAMTPNATVKISVGPAR